MKNLSRNIAKLILISAFSAPATLLAADKLAAPDPHHPNTVQSVKTPDKQTQVATGKIQERMHARMLAMQNTSDPHARQTMMMDQMQDMMDMMRIMGSGCPMLQGMGDMMGGQGGMMGKPTNVKPAK
jgi:hypothetical protein